MKKIVNPINEEFIYEYNDRGLLKSKTLPIYGETKYWYDERSRLVASEDELLNQFVTIYDEYNRQIESYSSVLATPISFDAIISTDDLQNLDQVSNTDPIVRTIYEDDKTWVDRVIQKTRGPNGSEPFNFSVIPQQDDLGRVYSSRNLVSGNGIAAFIVDETTTWNNANQVTTSDWNLDHAAISDMGFSHVMQYDELLRPVSESLTHGFETQTLRELSYDNRDLVSTSWIGSKITGLYLQEINYSYDAIGRLTRINDPIEQDCFEAEEYCKLTIEENFNRQPRTTCLRFSAIMINGERFELDNILDVLDDNNSEGLEKIIQDILNLRGLQGTASVSLEPLGIYWDFVVTVTNTSATDLVLIAADDNECEDIEAVKSDCCVPVDQGNGNDSGAESISDDLFYENIIYDGINISHIDYQSDCALGQLSFDFEYDGDHRILNSLTNPQANEEYDATFSYDAAGNIQSITRDGFISVEQNAPPVFGAIDQLAFTYESGTSLLSSVEDAISDIAGSKGFSQNTSYVHDDIGNIIEEPGRSLKYEYSEHNLPVKVTKDGSDIRKMHFLPGGKKAFYEESNGDFNTKKLYIGPFEIWIANGSSPYIKYYNHSAGRMSFDNDPTVNPKWQYEIKDHLGNKVVIFADKNGDSEILTSSIDDPVSEVLQRNLSYPFGMDLEHPTLGTSSSIEQDFKYNGKEYDEDFGLYFYGARYYNPSIGRFTGVDPISDQFAHVSVYNYAENRVPNGIDLWGLQFLDVSQTNLSVSNGQIWKRNANVVGGVGRRGEEYIGNKISIGQIGIKKMSWSQGAKTGLANIYKTRDNERNMLPRASKEWTHAREAHAIYKGQGQLIAGRTRGLGVVVAIDMGIQVAESIKHTRKFFGMDRQSKQVDIISMSIQLFENAYDAGFFDEYNGEFGERETSAIIDYLFRGNEISWNSELQTIAEKIWSSYTKHSRKHLEKSKQKVDSTIMDHFL